MIEIPNESPETGTADANQSCPIDSSAQGSECGTSLWKPPKFDLRFLFLVLSLVAIWFALLRFQSRESMSVISVIMLTYLFGCPRTRNAVLTVVPAMYLPFAWLLVYLYPFAEYHWAWFLSWGQIPGLVPAIYLPHDPDGIADLGFLPAFLTVVIFFAGVLPIRFSNRSRWWFAIPLLSVCVLFSTGAFRFFRA